MHEYAFTLSLLHPGPKSSVQLSTPYLDERVRVGRGSRGSLFLFTRGGEASKSDMASVGLQKTTFAGLAALGIFFSSLVVTGAVLWASANPLLRAVAVLTWMVSAGMAAVLNKGGIVQEDRSIRTMTAPAS